jgi:hypothetical protein
MALPNTEVLFSTARPELFGIAGIDMLGFGNLGTQGAS